MELLEGLLRRILEWRDRKAVALSMAPTHVLPEHLAKRIAYSKVTSVAALRDAGVRIVGVEELAAVVAAELQRHAGAEVRRCARTLPSSQAPRVRSLARTESRTHSRSCTHAHPRTHVHSRTHIRARTRTLANCSSTQVPWRCALLPSAPPLLS